MLYETSLGLHSRTVHINKLLLLIVNHSVVAAFFTYLVYGVAESSITNIRAKKQLKVDQQSLVREAATNKNHKA